VTATRVLSETEAQDLVVDVVVAIYADDMDRVTQLLTRSYEPNAINIGFVLRALPIVTAVYLRKALLPTTDDAPTLVIPHDGGSTPAEDMWWVSRIMAAALADDRDNVYALVNALQDRVESAATDEASDLCSSVLVTLTQMLVSAVCVYIARVEVES